ncbi:MAG: sulfurtransferase TusA family protein [Actinomycetota bacterium]
MSAPDPPPVVIDGGGRTCVALLIELRGQIAGLAPGTMIHLIASDPAAPLDLAAWCHLTGHAYLGPVHQPPGAPAYALRITAARRQTQPGSPWRLTR